MVSEDASDGPAPRADAFPGRGETVLVVEDDPRVRRLAVRRLAGLGYRVLEAADGPGALSVLEASWVDLLFSDMAMPGGLTGVDLVRRARERQPGLPAVITSGYAVPESLADLPPGTGWLPKPYTGLGLARALRAGLDGAAVLEGA
jgi:CheY-like chemotaxis protein